MQLKTLPQTAGQYQRFTLTATGGPGTTDIPLPHKCEQVLIQRVFGQKLAGVGGWWAVRHVSYLRDAAKLYLSITTGTAGRQAVGAWGAHLHINCLRNPQSSNLAHNLICHRWASWLQNYCKTRAGAPSPFLPLFSCPLSQDLTLLVVGFRPWFGTAYRSVGAVAWLG